MFGQPAKSRRARAPEYDGDDREPPTVPAFLVESKMSESYARAVQEFQQMQEALRVAQRDRDQLAVDLEVARRENERLRDAMKGLEEQTEEYRRRVYHVEAQIDACAQVLIRLHDHRLSPAPATAPVVDEQRLLQDIEAEPGSSRSLP